MDGADLKNLMLQNGLNVKKTAALLCVSERAVYLWVAGSRRIPEIAVELLKVKLEGQPNAR